jgi:hypothetical protein
MIIQEMKFYSLTEEARTNMSLPMDETFIKKEVSSEIAIFGGHDSLRFKNC